MATASGCSLARSTLAARRRTSASVKPGAGTMAVTAGLPSVSVPVLSTTSVSTFSMCSSASAFLISTPAWAPRPTPTMIDIGVARPSAHGTGDDQHRHGGHEAVGEPRLRSPDRPGDEGQHRHADDGRHEVARDLVGQALDRGAAALRLGHELDDLRQHGVAPDLLRLDDEAAGLVHGAADHLGADLLGHRHRLAGHHRLVDRAAPLEHGAVDRHLLARAHPQAVARPARCRAGPPAPCRRA